MAKQLIEAQAERIARATDLLDAKAYVVSPSAIFVFSDRPGVPGYEVEAGRCSCPDATIGFAARHGISCKHVELARMVAERAASAVRERAARRLEEISAMFAA